MNSDCSIRITSTARALVQAFLNTPTARTAQADIHNVVTAAVVHFMDLPADVQHAHIVRCRGDRDVHTTPPDTAAQAATDVVRRAQRRARGHQDPPSPSN